MIEKLKRLKAALDSTGYPVAYRMFKVEPDKPYICYYVVESDNFAADGKTYYQSSKVAIELYSKGKRLDAEAAVDEALHDYYFDKTEYYIESEEIYEIVYQLII